MQFQSFQCDRGAERTSKCTLLLKISTIKTISVYFSKNLFKTKWCTNKNKNIWDLDLYVLIQKSLKKIKFTAIWFMALI